MKKVGIISDTHGLLRPEAIEALQGSDLIIHAGDIGKQNIIDALSTIAPVTAVRGNVDKGDFGNKYPIDKVLSVEEASIYVLHIKEALKPESIATDIHVVVTGHSHKPSIETDGGIVYLNPGSAGPKRFSLPITVATLVVDGSEVSAEIIELIV